MFPPNGPRSPSATSLSVRQSSTCTTPKTSTASRWKSELRRELLARFPSTSSPPSACVPKSSASRSTVAQQSFMSRRVASTSMSSCAFPCPPDHPRCAYASKTILDSPTIPPCPFSEPVPRACGSCPRLGHPPAIASRSACPASRGASTASPPGTPHRLSSSPVPSSQKGPLRSEEHTSELQSRLHLVCRLLLEKKNTNAQRATRLNVHLSCTTSDRSISMRTTITRTCNEHSIPLRHEPITTYKYRRRSACTHVS